jgi:hypothetical protein
MEEDKQDIFIRAYVRLSSLRNNIDQITTGVLETFVNEFHAVLDKLGGLGIDVSEFRIPDSMVKPKIKASWSTYGETHHTYSNEKYVDKIFILTKLDAILGYFEIITSEKPRKIGFHPPDKQDKNSND